jgi:hypothetical protein
MSDVSESWNYVEILRKRSVSLLIFRGGAPIFENSGGGMRPLLLAISSLGRKKLRGTVVVDKIVGKAAALLIAYFKPRIVYCGTLSRRAEIILTRYKIPYIAEETVPEICRPKSKELCPFEESVLNVETPLQAYRHLVLRFRSLRNPDL